MRESAASHRDTPRWGEGLAYARWYIAVKRSGASEEGRRGRWPLPIEWNGSGQIDHDRDGSGQRRGASDHEPRASESRASVRQLLTIPHGERWRLMIQDPVPVVVPVGHPKTSKMREKD